MWAVSLAQQAGLCFTWSEAFLASSFVTKKNISSFFSATRLLLYLCNFCRYCIKGPRKVKTFDSLIFHFSLDTQHFGTYHICDDMPLINAHDITSEAGGLWFDISLHLHPYFVYASSKGSGESAHRLSICCSPMR